MAAPEPGKTLGLILAGGASRRFGADKRLAMLGGTSLIMRVAERALPQTDLLAINAPCLPQGLSLPLITDDAAGEGPLAGVLAGLRWSREHGFGGLAVFPCDTPFFPADMVARLRASLPAEADFAMARSGPQIQPAFALIRVAALDLLERAYSAGLRSMKGLSAVLRGGFADFSDCRDGPGGECFFNINSPDDLSRAQAYLHSGR